MFALLFEQKRRSCPLSRIATKAYSLTGSPAQSLRACVTVLYYISSSKDPLIGKYVLRVCHAPEQKVADDVGDMGVYAAHH